MKKIIISLCMTLTVVQFAFAGKPGFAIVIDPESFDQAEHQVKEYAAEIEKQGLHVHMVIDRWQVPDSIRKALADLYAHPENPIEGAVLIGDIPIAMVRDAQHMTSAFKMDQVKFDRRESSVPSDRYYDDFDLRFDLIERDDELEYLWYYSLRHDCPQVLRPSIYSGRIRPTDDAERSRYDKLRDYLEKVMAEKRSGNVLDQVLYFSGNGFVSESVMARIDEKATLYEHFPWLRRQQNGIGYIDHRRDKYVKFRLMNEMQREDLDLAILHHHGVPGIQYMNNEPAYTTTAEQIAAIQRELRETIRYNDKRGRDIDSVKNTLSERLEVPLDWFDFAYDPHAMAADSMHNRNLDLYLDDFAKYTPNSRVVFLDTCFNGAFQNDEFIANAYIFGRGKTVVAFANSVNVLQDKWADRFIGLLGLGVRAGNVVKYGPYLEGHLIGDPTFTFAPSGTVADLNRVIADASPDTWREMLNDPYPDVRALAMENLFRESELEAADLLDIFRSSDSHIVRLQALVNLSEAGGPEFIECVTLALDDSYEMIARFAMNMVAKSGDERLIAPLVKASIVNNTSERIEFSIKQALPMFETDKLLAELERQFPSTNYIDSEKVYKQIHHSIDYNSRKWIEPMEKIMAEDTKHSSRMQEIRSMRNYQVHFMVPKLLEYLQRTGDQEVQQAMLEAFGWFGMSCHAADIARVALDISNDAKYSAVVRNEAEKTYRRLTRL